LKYGGTLAAQLSCCQVVSASGAPQEKQSSGKWKVSGEIGPRRSSARGNGSGNGRGRGSATLDTNHESAAHSTSTRNPAQGLFAVAAS